MVQPEFLKTRTITTQRRACHVSLHNACARPITADLICLHLRFGTWFFSEKFIDFVEKRRLLLRSFVSGLLAFVFAEAIRTYWSVYSCFAGIFITVFVACRSNKIAYFLPYRPLSGTRHQLHLYIFVPLTSGVAITFPGFPKFFRGFFWQPPYLMCLVKHES